MIKTAVVTGIPGTGKTTVCNLVKRMAKEMGVEINMLNYGTVTMESLHEYGENIERDNLRKADLDFQRKLQKRVAEVISEKMGQLGSMTIIDTHMTIKTPSGYLPGLPYHVMQILKPEILILVEAEPTEVSARRMKDTGRKRDDTTDETVKEELLFSRLMAGACAVLTGAPVMIAVNTEGKPEEAAREILRTIGVM